MTIDGWQPLSRRGSEETESEPVLLEGVPAHLEQPLRKWLASFLDAGKHGQRVALRLRVLPVGNWGIERSLVNSDPSRLLDIIDAALHWHPYGIYLDEYEIPPQGSMRVLIIQNFLDPVTHLEQILTDAGSAWTTADRGRSLQRRVDGTVREAYSSAIMATSASARPEAARDLAAAWAKTYGLHPEPSEAYRLAIRAVEDVTIPLVVPRDSRATLGKVRDHLRDASTKWRTSMGPGADEVVAMINLLWTRQTDRHAGQAELERVNQAGAEQAVHLATTLVQWFAGGHVQRCP